MGVCKAGFDCTCIKSNTGEPRYNEIPAEASPTPAPPATACRAFAGLVSRRGGAFANFVFPRGWAVANPGAIPKLLSCMQFPIRI